jgi:UTP--glucose-1-phosphate uridylyltransferase
MSPDARPVRKAVITAAGRGTRQYPASSAVQKEMFPMVDRDGLAKPVVQIIGEEAIAAGVTDICIVTQPGEEKQYRNYFQRLSSDTLQAFKGKDWALRASEKLQVFGEHLHFVAQDKPDGYGHAVHQARDFVGDEPFLLMLGDHIYVAADDRNCAGQLIDQYARSGLDAMSAVQPTPADKLHLFGTVKGDPLEDDPDIYRVTAIQEKPTPEYAKQHLRTPGLPANQYLCHFGMNIFPPDIFESLQYHIDHDIREGGEIQLTNAQDYMRTELLGGSYGACLIAGKRYDTGIPYGLMESQIALALSGVHQQEITQAIAKLLAEPVAAGGGA